MGNYINLLIAMHVSSSILIILTNLIILFVILFSEHLRRMPKNMLIMGMAVADLLMGSFVTPVYTRMLVEESSPDCHTHLALQVIGEHGIFLVVGWSLVTYNILYIKKLSKIYPWGCRTIPLPMCLKGFVLTVWPWVAAACTLVPLVLTNRHVYIQYSFEDVMCVLDLPRSQLIMACVLSLYLPFYLCGASVMTIVVCYSRGCHRRQSERLIETESLNDVTATDDTTEPVQPQPQSDNNQLHEEKLLAPCTPNAVYLVCYVPLMVLTWLHLNGISTPFPIHGVITFAALARSFLLPLSWLLFNDINSELCQFWKKLRTGVILCAKHPPTTTSSSISFSRLQETQTI